ncbi:uncharacterized protein ACB058_012916 [Synchiropus picturatus]
MCSRNSKLLSLFRNVFFADVINGKLESSKMVTVRFTEFEACVATITDKVKEALGEQEPVILTDSQGNKIIDSEGTRGSGYWKQNSRKVFAVPEAHLLQVNKRRRRSRREDTGLQEVVADIEDVVEAGLKEVSQIIKDLSAFGHSTLTTTLSLSEAEGASLREICSCLACKGLLKRPMFSTCCRSLIGLDLMDEMLSLLGSEDGGFLFPHIFLRQFPPSVRAGLANSPCLAAGDFRGLAEEADRILLTTRRAAVYTLVVAPQQSTAEGAEPAMTAGVSSRRRRGDLCFFHHRFGVKAQRCVPPCSYDTSGNGRASAQ